MPRKRRSTKSLYVIKSHQAELRDLEEKKRSETKNVYVLRTDEETVNKYADTIFDFVDSPGVFVLVTRDKTFYHTFKSTITFELGIEMEFIKLVPDLKRAEEVLDFLGERGVRPFVFLERAIDSELTLPFVQFMRNNHPEGHVVILSREVNRERLFQFHEEGAHSFLQKPVSANAVIKRIAFLLKPQHQAQAMVNTAREEVNANRFDKAVDICERILRHWPKTASAMVVLGDAKKGLAKRREALGAYVKAERNSENYLEPLQKIAQIHLEDGNADDALKYLVKLDRLSPLNRRRKMKIAEMHFEKGDPGQAEQYFDNAIKAAKEEAMSVMGEMSLDIAEMAAQHQPELAAKYYRKSLEFVKNSKSGLAMTIYNRLGISLRRQGLWQEAIEAYVEAATHAPKDENIHYNMALAYADGKQYPQSARTLRKVLDINPEMYDGKPEIAYQMATIFTNADEKPLAERCLVRLNQMSPGYKGCDKLLKKLGAA